jgi:mitochondrial intermembrane space import and assembly protein 40
MAYGPCGEQFRAAFSCFVFSKEEPKGVDCIENFKAMQNCFREHPDVYGSELEDDEAPPAEGQEGQVAMESNTPEPEDEGPAKSAEGRGGRGAQPETGRTTQELKSVPPPEEKPASEEEELVPKAWHSGK